MSVEIFNTKNVKRLNKKLDQIGAALLEEANNVKSEVGKILLNGGIEIRNDIIKSIQQTPRQTDWFYPRQKGKKKHYPSKEDNPPAIDSGNMIRTIVFDAKESKLIIGSIQTDPPYPEWLEIPPKNARYGARPWLAPAVDRQEPIIIKNLEKIIPDIAEKIFRR